MTHISVKVDGTTYEDDVEPRLLLVHYLRDRLGLTGTPIGCDTSNCGACTVESDGVSVRSCSVLAVQADGGEVTTVEGLARDGELTPLDSYEFTCTGVFTTRTPTDAYRGAGRPEATYAIERIMDELAVELGLDPLELRRRNWIRHEEFPYTSIAGLTYDSGNYEAATDKALALFDYDKLRAEQADRNHRGDTVRLGIGVSAYTEMCGLAPSRVLRDLRYAAGGWEAASIRMLPTGKVEVVTGTSPHGQGHVTSWSQIAADVLGVPFEDVEVVHGDTKVAPQGMDTYGSRSLVVGGSAVHHAARKVVDKARKIAAHLLEAAEQDLEFTDGVFSVKGSPDARRTIQEIAFETITSHG